MDFKLFNYLTLAKPGIGGFLGWRPTPPLTITARFRVTGDKVSNYFVGVSYDIAHL